LNAAVCLWVIGSGEMMCDVHAFSEMTEDSAHPLLPSIRQHRLRRPVPPYYLIEERFSSVLHCGLRNVSTLDEMSERICECYHVPVVVRRTGQGTAKVHLHDLPRPTW